MDFGARLQSFKLPDPFFFFNPGRGNGPPTRVKLSPLQNLSPAACLATVRIFGFSAQLQRLRFQASRPGFFFFPSLFFSLKNLFSLDFGPARLGEDVPVEGAAWKRSAPGGRRAWIPATFCQNKCDDGFGEVWGGVVLHPGWVAGMKKIIWWYSYSFGKNWDFFQIKPQAWVSLRT